MNSTANKNQFVREHYHQIDSLRAIAVIGVIAYHLGLSWVPGGFLGVDLFFVISGYVITRNLIDSINITSELDIKKFYWARIRRIYPALLANLIITSFLIFCLAKDAAARFISDILFVILGINNWRLVFLHQNYFSQTGRPPLLQQTWTLAVELQFYLIWPLVLNFIWKRFGKKRIPFFSLVIALLSAAVLLYISIHADSNSKVSHIYFGTDTHSIGLFLGSALAVNWIPRNLRENISINAKRFFTFFGIASILLIFLMFFKIDANQNLSYEIAIPAMSVTGALAIFALIHPASYLKPVLNSQIMIWLGERSYGIYIWHWVIFQITRPGIDLTGPSWALNTLRVLIVLVLSDISYRVLELPARTGVFTNWWRGLKYRTKDVKFRSQVAVYLVGVSLILGSSFSVIKAKSNFQNQLKVLQSTNSAAGNQTVPVISNQQPKLWVTGDSVILGSVNYLAKYYHLSIINARVGRQIGELIDAVKSDQIMAKSDDIVLDVGNNNVLSKDDLVTLLDLVTKQPKVVLINTAVPRTYRDTNNKLIQEIITNYKNIVLADWNQISAGHPEYFAPDGVHLIAAGDTAYVGAIKEALDKPLNNS